MQGLFWLLWFQEHYKDLKQKSSSPAMIDYITSGPVVSMVYLSSHWVSCDIPVEYAFWFYVCKAWEGVGVVASARKLIGATDPLQAEPGTIRGDLAVQKGR